MQLNRMSVQLSWVISCITLIRERENVSKFASGTVPKLLIKPYLFQRGLSLLSKCIMPAKNCSPRRANTKMTRHSNTD